jgi:cytochrome c oxidase cbb3-type subunit 3
MHRLSWLANEVIFIVTTATDTCDRPGAAMYRRILFAALTSLAMLALGGCDFPGRPKEVSADAAARPELSFGSLFTQHCAGCHGKDGFLGAAPPLNDALYRAIVPREQVEQAVRDGRKGTPMPAFARRQGGTLSDEEIAVLVRGIKGEAAADKLLDDDKLGGRATKDGHAVWAKATKPPENAPRFVGPETPPQLTAARLESIRDTTFARACASCHGKHGEGGSKAAKINDVALLSLFSDLELRRIIITGRPDLGMPDYADGRDRGPDFHPLNDQETTEFVELLRQWRRDGAASTDGSAPVASHSTLEHVTKE